MNILFIGAHTDDIEHGAGGTLARLLKKKEHNVLYLTLSRCTDLPRNKGILEDQAAITSYINERGGTVWMFDLQNRLLPEGRYPWKIREILESARDNFHPHIVFTHWKHDIHQDHKAVVGECLRVFRNLTVLGYECVRSCPGFAPNFFISLSEEDLREKAKLINLYETQRELYYNVESVIESLAVARGAIIGQALAEGFDLVRMVAGESCVQLL